MIAEMLCNHHFAVCRFNMSRSGIGENPETFDRLDLFRDDTYSAQLADLRTVVRYCRSMTRLPIFLLGHSRGGGIALLGARDVGDNLQGVITWSAISHCDNWDDATKAAWRREGHLDVVNARTKQVMPMSTRMLDDFEANRERLDILAATAALDVPLLVLHGGHDESVPVEQSAEIAARSRDASRIVIATATHTFNAIHPLVNVPPQLALASDVTCHFVTAYA
jgi:alpha-beta hydrolase superfamily lysophospholipase